MHHSNRRTHACSAFTNVASEEAEQQFAYRSLALWCWRISNEQTHQFAQILPIYGSAVYTAIDYLKLSGQLGVPIIVLQPFTCDQSVGQLLFRPFNNHNNFAPVALYHIKSQFSPGKMMHAKIIPRISYQHTKGEQSAPDLHEQE